MADRTACSASSEYGGCRSLNGSRLSDGGGAIEYSTDELDIFPRGTFPRRIAQQRRRVVGDDQWHAVVAMHLASELSDRQLRLQQSRSEEHTSELQSRLHLVCRLLLEKKKKQKQ